MTVKGLLRESTDRFIQRIARAVDDQLSNRLNEIRVELMDHVAFVAETERNLTELTEQPPWIAFREASDEYWLWANTSGRRYYAGLRDRLPDLPPEYNQKAVASLTGDDSLRQAFGVYTFFRDLIEVHRKPAHECSALLDYGCGWGRILRFFLRELEGSKLWGVDVWEEQVLLARETDPYCRFEVVGESPPTSLPDRTFDVVFAYSVFSHVSEEIHRQLLEEFSRVLVPGGLLIVTTWGRDRARNFEVAAHRASSWDSHYNEMMTREFPGRREWERQYDDVGFSHVDLHYNGVTGYGETSIARSYVERNWREDLKLVDFISDRAVCEQDVIVARKLE